MTDKERIRAYIEKLHKEHRGSEGDSIFRRALRTVLFYIDSMQEEPVSEDSEKAAWQYADQTYDDSGFRLCATEAFEAGAKWQEKKDQSIIELAEDHAMFAGMEKMKEEMMAEAIDGQLEDSDDYLRIKCLSTSCKPEDNGKLVKVIIVKED